MVAKPGKTPLQTRFTAAYHQPVKTLFPLVQKGKYPIQVDNVLRARGNKFAVMAERAAEITSLGKDNCGQATWKVTGSYRLQSADLHIP